MSACTRQKRIVTGAPLGNRRSFVVAALTLILALTGFFAGQVQVRAEELTEPASIVDTVEDAQVDERALEEVEPTDDGAVEERELDAPVEAITNQVAEDVPPVIEEGQALPPSDEVVVATIEEAEAGKAEEEPVSEEVIEEPLALAAASSNTSAPSVTYCTHVQNVGWQNWVSDGAMSGTSGKAYRLEGINIKLNGVSGGVTYRTHVQNIGWQGWKSNGEMSGTSGQSLRLEAIEIKLTGDAANKYDVYYRVHCQNIGWMGWAKNGERSGTAGYGYRLEGIQIKLVAKNGSAPDTTVAGVSQNSSSKFKDAGAPGRINYRTHVQNEGWQDWVADGAISGTQGKSYRLEGINIKLNGVTGGITYRTHVQNIGWQGWKSNGEMSGTSGQSLRLEAIQIKLTGEAADKYDVYYRVHCQNIGWMGWAKNGEAAGSAGYSYRLEGINIKLVAKGAAAPGSTSNAFTDKNNCKQVLVKAAWDERVVTKAAWDETVTSWKGFIVAKVESGWHIFVDDPAFLQAAKDAGKYVVHSCSDGSAACNEFMKDEVFKFVRGETSKSPSTQNDFFPVKSVIHHPEEYKMVHHDAQYSTVCG